jgi:hypothetical protein
MSTNTAVLSANAATAALKATKEANKAELAERFIQSALATFEATKVRGGAAALAALNKETGVGYGSETAVGFHGETGRFILLPTGEFAESATKVQATIKKVGVKEARVIITKSKTQDAAWQRLQEALSDKVVDITALLEKAAALVAEAEHARLQGNALPQDALDSIAKIRVSLENVVLGDAPIKTDLATV